MTPAIRSSLKAGQNVAKVTDGGVLMFDVAFEKWLQHGDAKPRTTTNYRNALAAHLTKKELRTEITRLDGLWLNEVFKRVTKGHAVNGVARDPAPYQANRLYSILKAVLRFHQIPLAPQHLPKKLNVEMARTGRIESVDEFRTVLSAAWQWAESGHRMKPRAGKPLLQWEQDSQAVKRRQSAHLGL